VADGYTVLIGVATVIVAIGAIISPVLVIRANTNATKDLKEQEWEREDKKASLLLDAQSKQTDALLLAATNQRDATTAAAERIAQTAQTIAGVQNDKLDVIHGLVNSNLTASMQGELNALRALLIALEGPPEKSEEMLQQIIETKARIADLSQMIKDRQANGA